MVNNLIDPVVKDYLLHDAPLRSFFGKVLLALIVAGLLVLAYFGWTTGFGEINPFMAWLWVPYSVVGSILAYLVIAFLDRERRVRFFHFLTMASVALVTAPIAALINANSPARLWTVGFGEEGFKILPVLLLAIFVPNLIRTKKDGIVYGALAGMGFNIIEIGFYIAQALHNNTIIESLYMHSTRLGVWGFGSHIIWSAFVGLGIGFAAESTAHGWQKWQRAVLFYVLAALAHSAYDLAGSAVGVLGITFAETWWTGTRFEDAMGSTGTVPGPLRDGMKYGQYIWNIGFIIVLFINIRKSFAWENTLQAYELGSEGASVVTKAELKKVEGERLFFKRRYPEFPKSVSERIVLYQNLLAMQKHTAAQQGRPVEKFASVNALRRAIQTFRSK